jgi:D-alanine-D-alanine ligase-like ATP-grasp enzyme
MCENIRIRRSIDDGYLYARDLGFPVILKPNNLSQGVLVSKIYNKIEYYRVARSIFKRTGVMLVQRYYAGRDYRLVVLDDEVVSAYERIPLTIRGDGESTVAELLEQKQEEFTTSGRDTIIDTEDFRLKDNLRRRKLKFKSVLELGNDVRLLDNANLSTGGDAIDISDRIHPDYRSLAVDITKRMELRLCGVDLIARDIAVPPGDYIVIEINGSPGLDNYAKIGAAQQDIVDGLYLKVLMALESEL